MLRLKRPWISLARLAMVAEPMTTMAATQSHDQTCGAPSARTSPRAPPMAIICARARRLAHAMERSRPRCLRIDTTMAATIRIIEAATPSIPMDEALLT